ncbi:DUF485 domain-containing protein [Tessaracoccus lubricantis]|uniref:DUF485 domain-containing protein n=1 Tax=Tessaracoccus lubricantis TaxID=545543 RepID=A0ABP9FDN0_9ACTN
MSDVQSPHKGTIPPEEFHRVQQSENFAHLKKVFRTFAFPMTLVFLVWYLAYVFGSIFAKDLMMTPVFGNVSVGFLFGIGQFISTFLITWLYIRHMNKKVDPVAEGLRAELEGNAR